VLNAPSKTVVMTSAEVVYRHVELTENETLNFQILYLPASRAVYDNVHHLIVIGDLLNMQKRDHPEKNDEYVDSTETVGESVILW
jgi:hypothetical protein